MTTVLFIGDQHFKTTNIPEVELFIEKITELAKEKSPDLIILAGDLLDCHERLHTTPLNKAYKFIDSMRKISKTYVIVGNHDYCLGKDVPVMLWNGNRKMSQDIKKGDELIGDDGNCTTVINTTYGKTKMYKIKQMEGEDYIVNENHILTLKIGYHKSIFWNKTKQAWTVKWIDINNFKLRSKFFSLRYRISEKEYLDYMLRSKEEAEIDAKKFMSGIKDIDTIDIPVKKILEFPKNIKDRLYGFKLNKSVKWPYIDVDIDPYILGSWLGDGCKTGESFASADPEIIIKWYNWCIEIGAEITHSGQYNYGIRNNKYKSNKKDNLINSSSYTCKACINHIKKYNCAPSIMCANLEELKKILSGNTKVKEYFYKNSSVEQKLFLDDINNIKKLREWKQLLLSKPIKKSSHNYSPLRKLLKQYNLYNNKHIPQQYITNSENVRLQLLAGFIDTDGTVVNKRQIIITQGGNNIHMINELEILVKSLGFKCNISNEIKNNSSYHKILTISGKVEKIPMILNRKKCEKIINNGIDKRGRKCADKSRTKITIEPLEVSEYYGFETDNKNHRFLLGDFTVTHNCNNQQYLTENHWLNSMKEWDNTIIVDKVVTEKINDQVFVFVPYVPPGRFEEALNILDDEYKTDWKKANCIFAHQEFFGCKMGAITSVEGDKWSLDYPEVVSGHIHSKQRPQKNIYYSGSAMQHAFGESTKNIIAHFTFTNNKYDLDEIDLNLPRKKIVYMDIENIEDYSVPETDDKIKITVSGSYDQFKALKKTKKYKKLVDKGLKVVFKSKKIDHKEDLPETVVNETAFSTILNEIINKKKDNYLYETYELVVNNNQVNNKDIIYLDN